MSWNAIKLLLLIYTPLWALLLAQPQPTKKCPPSTLELMRTKCQTCHSPSMRGGLLNMDSVDNMVRGGKHGPAIVVRKPESSLVYAVLVGRTNIPDVKGHHIPAVEVARIKAWIADGALQMSMSGCSP